jgi:predicted alpha-1,6-mannanase (GH76 family)
MSNTVANEAADRAQNALTVAFWDAGDVLFRHRLPHDRTERFCYWWHAHAIDALLDGYLRTRDQRYMDLIQKELKGTIAHNGGTILNNWYDDMEWMALALLRLWDETKEDTYKKRVDILWQDIKTAWNDEMGGGMAWRKNQLDYKNTPANAPAAILAFRLYERFGNEDDLDWGKKIFEWNRDNLMDPETFYVWDGMNRTGDGTIDYEWAFTYNQGVMIGAAVEYYRIMGDKAQLDLARNIAYESKRRFGDPHGGIFPYEGKDDCGLFRGIFFRYLAELIKEAPEETELYDMLMTNAKSIAEKGMSDTGVIGGYWDSNPGETVDLAQHLSGVMVLEMAAQALKENEP